MPRPSPPRLAQSKLYSIRTPYWRGGRVTDARRVVRFESTQQVRLVREIPTPQDELHPGRNRRREAEAVPDFNPGLPNPNPTCGAVADLTARLNGAVVVGHSGAGAYPLQAALIDPEGIRGLVLLEPPHCSGVPHSDGEIATLATIPILAVFGDHLDAATGLPTFSWQYALEDCKAFIARVSAAGGNAQLLHTPDLGIYGNSHMLMQDDNSLRIAGLICDWIAEHGLRGATPRSSASQ